MTTAQIAPGRFVVLTRAAAPYWWLFIASGTAWLLFAVILFRFDYLTVDAIAILFGVSAIMAGAVELVAVGAIAGGWKIAHAVLGVVFVAAGIVAFITPGGTFVALAAVMSVLLVLLGAFDIVAASMTKATSPAWWLQLAAGVAEVLLGFWAAGSWGLSAVLLVAWVAAFAVLRGVSWISIGLRLWELRRHATG
jgi:uncharacterized membrane protein HdeD (DUF308 family)